MAGGPDHSDEAHGIFAEAMAEAHARLWREHARKKVSDEAARRAIRRWG
jgi:hypothetical protein